jgi:DNA replication licensing factor MCM2
VSEDDLNLAVSVMLESFIMAQKFSVQRPLRRQFMRYLNVGTDLGALLLMKLREIVRERDALDFVRSPVGADAVLGGRLEVKLGELEERAARHGIERRHVLEFLGTAAFRDAGFTYSADRRLVVREA